MPPTIRLNIQIIGRGAALAHQRVARGPIGAAHHPFEYPNHWLMGSYSLPEVPTQGSYHPRELPTQGSYSLPELPTQESYSLPE